jgi:hypothetical protein
VLASITGSSAFGEVARAAFGFCKIPDDEDDTRLMSQAKNSAGVSDFSNEYKIETQPVTFKTGQQLPVARFVLGNPSDTTVGDVIAAGEKIRRALTAREWLTAWFTVHPEEQPVTDVVAAGAVFGYKADALGKARSKACLATRQDGFKGQHMWFRDPRALWVA